MTAALRKQFTQRLRDACTEAQSLGYTPSRMLEMLRQNDGVTIANNLIASGDIQTGLKNMFSLGRGDLAMESIMLESQFNTNLFKPQVLAAAQWRIDQVK